MIRTQCPRSDLTATDAADNAFKAEYALTDAEKSITLKRNAKDVVFHMEAASLAFIEKVKF